MHFINSEDDGRTQMNETDQISEIHHIHDALDDLCSEFPNYRFNLETSLNESWFSDALAWWLDPKGTHGLGIKGIEAFVCLIAHHRSNSQKNYARRNSFLKFGKAGRGTPSSKFRYRNISTVREYHLSSAIGAHQEQGPLYCDLVCMDFDISDSLLIVVENKLWGKNGPGQLTRYFETVEAKFKSQVECREYVYLTPGGENPIVHEEDNPSIAKKWVQIGWMNDLLPLMQEFHSAKPNPYLERVIEVMNWFWHLSNRFSKDLSELLVNTYRHAYEVCLREELNRLTGKGTWEIEYAFGSRRLKHTSVPARRLIVDIKRAGFSIEIQGLIHEKPLFESIIIPIGIHPNQSINLIDIAAREIMNGFFNDPLKIKNNAHWKKNKMQGAKLEYASLFELGYTYPNALRFLLTR
jgi:hypothetical protein